MIWEGVLYMESIKLQPLTNMEKKLAEENHNLVYSFLHRHGYSIEEFYNIVVFGYLKGIQVYCRRKDLQNKYQLAFICERYMQSEKGNYYRTENAKKRKPAETIISLDADYTETDSIYNCIGGKSVEDELLEVELLKETMENLSEIQREILKLKLEGYSNKEVHLSLEIPTSTYYKELDRIKIVFKGLVG